MLVPSSDDGNIHCSLKKHIVDKFSGVNSEEPSNLLLQITNVITFNHLNILPIIWKGEICCGHCALQIRVVDR